MDYKILFPLNFEKDKEPSDINQKYLINIQIYL